MRPKLSTGGMGLLTIMSRARLGASTPDRPASALSHSPSDSELNNSKAIADSKSFSKNNESAFVIDVKQQKRT